MDGETATHRFDSIRSPLGCAVNDNIGPVLVQEGLDGVVVLQVELYTVRCKPLVLHQQGAALGRGAGASAHLDEVVADTGVRSTLDCIAIARQSRLTKRTASVLTFMTGSLERLEDCSSEETCSAIPSQRLLLQITQVKVSHPKLQSLAF